MIRVSLIAALALAGSAGTALAQSSMMQNPPTQTTVCMDVNGQSLPAVCTVPGGRLDQREDICLCHDGQRVSAPVCGPGEKAPRENIAFDRARKAAARDGSLLGDLYDGRSMCVAPRNTF